MTKKQEKNSTSDWLNGLTQVALILALVLVLVRLTTLEVVRESFSFMPASSSFLGAGPTTTLILDLLGWMPAVLVLIRRAIDPHYALRLHLSHLLMGLLALWVVISCVWASDQFQAVITASTWCSAAALGWAMSQLVRSWARFRLVGGLGVGICLVVLIQTVVYSQLEWPETVRGWDRIKPQVMAERQWTEDDFAFKQFDGKVRRGEVVGYARSSNSFAAVAALVMFVAAGLAIQRWRDRDEPFFPVAIGIASASMIYVLIASDSRTAMAGSMICAVLLGGCWWFRDHLVKRSKLLFWFGVIFCVVVMIGVILIGLITGGLIHDSMTFRWQYWVGSWEIIKQHPLCGVGWSNFGSAYLPHRLAIATEEIKDPHNVFVKFATETGIIGLILFVAWIMRTAWESTRIFTPQQVSTKLSVPILIAVPVGFLILRTVTNYPLALVNTELLKIVLFTLAVGFGLMMGNIRSLKNVGSDDRPAPFLLMSALVGLAGFLLHGMVDFAMFDTGALVLMMVIVGSVLGVRHPGVVGKPLRTSIAMTALGVIFCGLLTYVALLVIPVAKAESLSTQSRTSMEARRYSAAASELREAFANAPVANADYASRLAQALFQSRDADAGEIVSVLTQAITSDPANALSWYERARFRRAIPQHAMGKPELVIEDYQQGLSRNPTDVQTRIEFADYLLAAGRVEEAKKQFQTALDYNDKLGPDESKRLKENVIAEIKRKMQ